MTSVTLHPVHLPVRLTRFCMILLGAAYKISSTNHRAASTQAHCKRVASNGLRGCLMMLHSLVKDGWEREPWLSRLKYSRARTRQRSLHGFLLLFLRSPRFLELAQMTPWTDRGVRVWLESWQQVWERRSMPSRRHDSTQPLSRLATFWTSHSLSSRSHR